MLGLTSFRRSTSSRVLRVVFLILAALCLTDLYSLSSTPPSRHSDFKSIPDVRSQRVFIASIHWNNARILQDNWNKAVLDLVEYFGVHNVYISIYESGSWDETKNALRMLESDLDELDVKRTITLEESTHLDEMQKPPTTGWIETPRGKKELRRIPYLSKLRNWSLQPLNELATKGIKFDKVLFLNDVVFDVCLLTLVAISSSDLPCARTRTLPNSLPHETANMQLLALSTLRNHLTIMIRSR